MIIILEGVDGTYKSSIGKNLSLLLDYDCVRGSSFETANLPNYELFWWYVDSFKRFKHDGIFERSFYSNRVYAYVYKDYSMLTFDQLKLLEHLVRTIYKQVLVVYCSAFPETIKSRLVERGDNYVIPEKIDELLVEYDRVIFGECGLPWMYTNTEEMNSRKAAEWIFQTITRGY